MAKTVLITGASRGIGRATLLELARRGMNVVGVCLKDKEGMEATIRDASEFDVMSTGITGINVGRFEDCYRVYEKLSEENIHIDCVVNNAAVSHIGLMQDMSVQEWNDIVATNLSSVFHMSKLFVGDMIKNHEGRIINVSSVWGNVGASCEVAYSATKSGVNGFTKALAKELAPSGIVVNAIAFGVIDTEMNNFLSEEELSELVDEIPMGRTGTPEEAAKIIADILEAPTYLTGQIITMDGGWQ